MMFEGVTEKPVSDFLLFEDEELKGTEYQGVIEFYNGYELSIVKHNSSYGGKMGLFEIALSKGKKLHDKRQDQKNKDWQRQKDRLKKLI